MNFDWMQEPESYRVEKDFIKIRAGKETNLFNGVSGTFKCGKFPFYCREWEGDFRIRCRVSVNFQSLYDLGGIVVWENEDKWMKLAYENSDTGNTSIVSVVTNERSDDCNGEPVTGSIWLQICRKENMFSMHYSLDKVNWRLVRIFHLVLDSRVRVGISAQCPVGEYCEVEFEGLEVRENPYEDIRGLK